MLISTRYALHPSFFIRTHQIPPGTWRGWYCSSPHFTDARNVEGCSRPSGHEAEAAEESRWMGSGARALRQGTAPPLRENRVSAADQFSMQKDLWKMQIQKNTLVKKYEIEKSS